MSAVIDVRCPLTFPHYLPIVPAITEHHCCIMRWGAAYYIVIVYTLGDRDWIVLFPHWQTDLLTVVVFLQTTTRNYYSFSTRRCLPCHSLKTVSHHITITAAEFYHNKYSPSLARLQKWPCEDSRHNGCVLWAEYSLKFTLWVGERWETWPELTGDDGNDRIKYQTISVSQLFHFQTFSSITKKQIKKLALSLLRGNQDRRAEEGLVPVVLCGVSSPQSVL